LLHAHQDKTQLENEILLPIKTSNYCDAHVLILRGSFHFCRASLNVPELFKAATFQAICPLALARRNFDAVHDLHDDEAV
jgi:hypothetical protein